MFCVCLTIALLNDKVFAQDFAINALEYRNGSVPNLCLIGQGDYRSPSIIAKLVKFVVLGPVGTTVFMEQGEIWHGTVHHGSILSCQFGPHRGKVDKGAPNLKMW